MNDKKPDLTRREFLITAGLSAIAGSRLFVPESPQTRKLGQGAARQNIIILLFDTLSALHLPLYGYPRNSAPNLSQFAAQAIVYHNHHSAANSTVPSTATLMTGTYPWTHRAFFGPPERQHPDKNLFHLLREIYHNSAFAQNLLADLILYQYGSDLDRHVNSNAFSLISSPVYQLTNRLFARDGLLGTQSTEGYYFSNRNRAGSLFWSILDRLLVNGRYRLGESQINIDYPKGLPYIWLHNTYYYQEAVFDGLAQLIEEAPDPFFAYLHLWSPHEPYRPRKEFIGKFQDEFTPLEKPTDYFGDPNLTANSLDQYRREYDEGIAHIDSEFGSLISLLKQKGVLENSYLFVTSDHGQLFERGIHGHVTPVIYEPLLHIPLIVSVPGSEQHQDIYSLTSTVDLMPTILQLNGEEIPDWCEGAILPGLGGSENPDRSIYALEAKENAAYQPLQKSTSAILKGQSKLIQYQGYDGHDGTTEFYDLGADPEELDNRYSEHPAIALQMEAELNEMNARSNDKYD